MEKTVEKTEKKTWFDRYREAVRAGGRPNARDAAKKAEWDRLVEGL